MEAGGSVAVSGRYTLLWMYILELTMQVSRWGNSLAIRLPCGRRGGSGAPRGDDVTLHAAGKRTLEIEKTPGAKELLARLRRFRGRLPKDFKFDRLEANERR
jgi:antitoxin MazE